MFSFPAYLEIIGGTDILIGVNLYVQDILKPMKIETDVKFLNALDYFESISL